METALPSSDKAVFSVCPTFLSHAGLIDKQKSQSSRSLDERSSSNIIATGLTIDHERAEPLSYLGRPIDPITEPQELPVFKRNFGIHQMAGLKCILFGIVRILDSNGGDPTTEN